MHISSNSSFLVVLAEALGAIVQNKDRKLFSTIN